jgi:hypothetical protein
MRFQGPTASGVIYENPSGYERGTIMIKGTTQMGNVVQWFAADPPARIYSKPGSYLAYPSPKTAISGRNCGITEVKNGSFVIICKKPNSYYANGGTILLPPHVVLRVWDRDQNVGDTNAVIGTIYENKGLTYHHERTGPEFYARNTQPYRAVRGQEDILRENTWKGEVSLRKYAEGDLI